MNKDVSRTRLRTVFKQLATVAVMVALLGYLFYRIPFEAVWQAVNQVSFPLYVVVMSAFVGLTLISDALAYWIAIHTVHPPTKINMRDTIVLRAASYVLQNVHYAAGQGTLVLVLYKRYELPLTKGVGVVLIITAANVLVLCLLVAFGAAIGAVAGDPMLRLFVTMMLVGAPLYLLLVFLKPAPLRRIKALGPLLDVGVGGTLLITAARTVHVALWLVCNWVVLRLFGVDLPIGEALLRFPFMFLVAALPITPGGIGTSQAAALMLFSDFAPGPTAFEREGLILAYSLSIQAINLVLQVLTGLFFARKLAQR